MLRMPKFILSFLVLLIVNPVFAVEIALEAKKTGISIVFEGKDVWDYNIDLKSNTLKITVPKLSSASVKKLKEVTNIAIIFVKINTDLSSRSDILEFKIPPGFDYFDYVLQKPSRLVVDIYNKNPKPVTSSDLEHQPKIDQEKKVDDTPMRSPSNEQKLGVGTIDDLQLNFDMDGPKVQAVGLFDASDRFFDRFKIPKSEIEKNPELKFALGNYIDYPFMDERLTILDRMKENMPEYRIEDNFSTGSLRAKEMEHARLLLTLFNRNRNLTFIKAAAWFEKTYPQSKYEEIVRAMWADTHYKIYLSEPKKQRRHLELAKARYEELIEKFPASELVPRIKIFMGYSSIEERDFISALRWFQRFVRSYPDSIILDTARLGVIRSLTGANQFAEAKNEIQSIRATTCHANIACRLKADLQLTDISINKKDWPAAEKIFELISREFPIDEITEERYFYNYASVMFAQRRFLLALDMYLEFITRFPNDKFAGFALTRIGEIIDINSTNSNRALGAYLEANFRYGTEVGSTALFARIRLLEKQLPSLSGRARQVAISEIINLSKSAKLPLAEDFGNFIVAEALKRSGDYDEALTYLVDYYRNHPTHSLNRVYFKKIQDIQARKLARISEMQPLEALKFHELLQIDWLKNTKRIDVTFTLAESYFKLGDYRTAEKFYKEAVEQIKSYDFSSIENQVAFMRQNSPRLSNVYLRLAHTQRIQKKWKEVEGSIASLDMLGEELLPSQKIERAALLSQVLKEKGQPEYALRYLTDMRKIASENPDREIDILFKEVDAFKKSADHKSIVQLAGSINRECVKQNPHPLCYKYERDVLNSMKKILAESEYATELREFLEHYSESRNLDDLRYELGRIYLRSNNIAEAERIWSQFRNVDSGWGKLAKSDLEGVKFDSAYRDYLKKIPSLSRSSSQNEGKQNE